MRMRMYAITIKYIMQYAYFIGSIGHEINENINYFEPARLSIVKCIWKIYMNRKT